MGGISLDEIATTIRRVRFGEVGFDGKDVKAVWHQGTEFDLVTQVDTEGKAVEQELVLRKDVVMWRRLAPLRTGCLITDETETADGERAPSARSGMINLDPTPRLNVLEQAVILVDKVPGDDKYLKHLATVFNATLDGRDANFDAVTGVQRMAPGPGQKAEPGLERLLKRLLGR